MIEEKDVAHVADLARLQLSKEELKKFGSQLDRILEHANKISELDTKDVEPTSHAVEVKNVFREDKIDNEIDRDQALANAPEVEDNGFKVPKIM